MLTGPIDALVGRRIKERRQALRMTQSDLAGQIDVRFQQIQKYESGQNRVAASRLWYIAQVLDVPVTYFFQDVTETGTDKEGALIASGPHRDVVELVGALSDKQKKALVGFLRTLPRTQKEPKLREPQ